MEPKTGPMDNGALLTVVNPDKAPERLPNGTLLLYGCRGSSERYLRHPGNFRDCNHSWFHFLTPGISSIMHPCTLHFLLSPLLMGPCAPDSWTTQGILTYSLVGGTQPTEMFFMAVMTPVVPRACSSSQHANPDQKQVSAGAGFIFGVFPSSLYYLCLPHHEP